LCESSSGQELPEQGWQVFARRWKKPVFPWKKPDRQKQFLPAKIGFCQNIFFYTFITIKYCCTAYIILTLIAAHFKFSVFFTLLFI